jgi:hypothetical protein
MKVKVLITFVFIVVVLKVLAVQPNQNSENENIVKSSMIDTDSLMHGLFSDTISKPKTLTITGKPVVTSNESKTTIKPVETKISDLEISPIDTTIQFSVPEKPSHVHVDSLLFLANPFFIELVYNGLPFDFKWEIQPDYRSLYYGTKATTLSDCLLRPVETKTAEQTVAELRQYAREQIVRKAADLYVMTFDDLPDPENYRSHLIKGHSMKEIQFVTDNQAFRRRRLIVKREQMGPWQYTAKADAQFSQNYVSSNWYQGGYSNVAILGIITGRLTYDDKKCIQWENSGEWHMGFNSIAGDTLRKLSTNDDVFKINSKLGIKAGGNWFYSGSVDFSTQLFNSYNGINSTTMKTSFLTPVRINIGVGLDYKYKKIFSLMISPVSYKYIYVKNSKHVDPNLFGILKGERVLSEIGSSFTATLCYPVSREIQLDSKLTFYTNYEKVEIDWEMVCNMKINRFMSTRISINPRYDNTIILTKGENTQIQFKQLLSVGFYHKFY